MNTEEKLTNKIDALEKYLKHLQDPSVIYDWYRIESCNCGILVQSICNVSQNVISSAYERADNGEIWEGMAEQLECKLTGLPLDFVFIKLQSLGFTKRDIIALEKLNGEYGIYYDKKENVIEYTKNWICELRSQLREAVIELPKDKRSDDTKGKAEDVKFLKQEKVKIWKQSQSQSGSLTAN